MQTKFNWMKRDSGALERIADVLFAGCEPSLAAEGALRIVTIWNRTLPYTTEQIEAGEVLHLSKVDAWARLSLTGFNAWLGAMEKRYPVKDLSPDVVQKIAMHLSEAQRALEAGSKPAPSLAATEVLG